MQNNLILQSYTFSGNPIFSLARNATIAACQAVLVSLLSKVTLYCKVCNFSNFCNFGNPVTGKVTANESVTFSGMALQAALAMQSYRSYRSNTYGGCNHD